MTNPWLFYNNFSIITQELQNFMDKASSDLNKITQAYTAAQENTCRLMENAISQALARQQDSTSTKAPPANLEFLDQTKNQTHEMMQTLPHPGKWMSLV